MLTYIMALAMHKWTPELQDSMHIIPSFKAEVVGNTNNFRSEDYGSLREIIWIHPQYQDLNN